MPVNVLLLSDMRTCIHFALGIFSRNFAPKKTITMMITTLPNDYSDVNNNDNNIRNNQSND